MNTINAVHVLISIKVFICLPYLLNLTLASLHILTKPFSSVSISDKWNLSGQYLDYNVKSQAWDIWSDFLCKTQSNGNFIYFIWLGIQTGAHCKDQWRAKLKAEKKCKHGLDFLEKEFQYFEKDLEMIKIPLSYMTICAQPLSNEFLTLPQAVDTEWNCKSFRHFWN